MRPDRGQSTRHVHITTVDAAPRVDSTLNGTVESVLLLGGAAKLEGEIGAEPARTGDEATAARLSAMPESLVSAQLRDALEGAGVDAGFHRAPSVATPASGVGLTPRAWPSYGGGPHGLPDNIWYRIDGGQHLGFYSWGFWSTTAVRVDRAHDIAIRAGAAQPVYRSGGGAATYYEQWWGAFVTVHNFRLPLCSVNWPYSCQNVAVYILAK